MEYQRVVCLQDEASHWYVIPYEMSKEFNYLMNKWYELDSKGDYEGGEDIVEEFEYKFGKYRTGGDLNNIELYTKID